MNNQRRPLLPWISGGLLLTTLLIAYNPLLACDSHDKHCKPSIQKKPLTAAEIRQGIDKKHPGTFCELSQAYFTARNNSDALKFFYVCQIRWKVYLLTEADQEAGGENAAFGSMNYMMGRAVTLVGESDIKDWADQVLAAIDWHGSNPSLFQDFSRFKEIETSVLAEFRQHSEDIRAKEVK